MNRIFACYSCKKVYSISNNSDQTKCPECYGCLVDLQIIEREWLRLSSEQQHDHLKDNYKKNEGYRKLREIQNSPNHEDGETSGANNRSKRVERTYVPMKKTSMLSISNIVLALIILIAMTVLSFLMYNKHSANEKDGLLSSNILDDSTSNASIQLSDKENTYEYSSAGQDSYDSDLQIGQIITFGAYEQDNNPNNGKEAIEWEVLDVDGENALLLSHYILDSVKYNEVLNDVTWKTCSLRNWLNNDFYNAAFSDEEKRYILTMNLVNEDNQLHKTVGGEITSDNVFCLSAADIRKYYDHDFTKWNESEQWGYCEPLAASPTEFAKSGLLRHHIVDEDSYNDTYVKKGYTRSIIGKDVASWWLRSPGHWSNMACTVRGNGIAGAGNSANVDTADVGVRPVIYVRIK